MTEKKIITKRELNDRIEANDTNVKFANRSLNKRLAKNRKIVERSMMLRENERRKAERATKLNVEKTEKIDMVADLSKEPDDQLISSMIVLGVTVADLIEGGVDAVRALRISKAADEEIYKRSAVRKLEKVGASGIISSNATTIAVPKASA